jgi:hypothetical protein
VRNIRIWALGLVLLGTLSACDRAPEADETAGDAAVPADAPAAAPAAAEPVKVDLDDSNDSGIKGEATATHSANDVTVSIVLTEGGKPEVSYPAHIHTGTCEKGGPKTVDLANVTNNQSSTTVPASSLPVNQDAFVQVHDPAGKAVACGDLKGHGPGAAATTTH